MKKLALCILCCLCTLTLCSCESSSMERQTFALCFGIDMDREGKLTLSVQTPMNGSGSGGNSGTPEYTVFSATDKDIDSAFTLLSASTPCPINFSQLRLCVIGYEYAARAELQPLLRQLSRLSSMRPTASVVVALGSAQEVLKAQKPDFGMRMSTHLNLYIKRLRDMDMMPDSTLTYCVRDLAGGRVDPLLAVCAINPSVKAEQSKSSGSGNNGSSGGGSEEEKKEEDAAAFAEGEPWSGMLLSESLIAGLLPRTGNDPVEYIGSIAVGNGRVSGALSAEETQIVLRTKRIGELRVIPEGEKTRLQIWLPKKQSELESLQPERVREVAEKLQALHCDALGFGVVAATGVATEAEWRAFGMERRYATAEIEVGIR